MRTMEVPETLQEKMELFRHRGRVVKYTRGTVPRAELARGLPRPARLPEGHDMRADCRRSTPSGADGAARRHPATAERMPDHVAHIARYCPTSV